MKDARNDDVVVKVLHCGAMRKDKFHSCKPRNPCSLSTLAGNFPLLGTKPVLQLISEPLAIVAQVSSSLCNHPFPTSVSTDEVIDGIDISSEAHFAQHVKKEIEFLLSGTPT